MTETRIEPEAIEKPPVPRRKKPGAISKFGHPLVGVFLFVPRLLKRGKHIDEVVIYSAHPAFFLWFVIATGFGLAALVALVPAADEFAGWAYIFVLTYFIVAILYDLSAKKLL